MVLALALALVMFPLARRFLVRFLAWEEEKSSRSGKDGSQHRFHGIPLPDSLA